MRGNPTGQPAGPPAENATELAPEGPASTRSWQRVNNRSVMPLDALGRTRATMGRVPGLPVPKGGGESWESVSYPGQRRVTRRSNKEFLVVVRH